MFYTVSAKGITACVFTYIHVNYFVYISIHIYIHTYIHTCSGIFIYLIQDNFQPIHGASTKGHLNIVQLLIDVYGIDPTVKAKVSMEEIILIYVIIMYCVLILIHVLYIFTCNW